MRLISLFYNFAGWTDGSTTLLLTSMGIHEDAADIPMCAPVRQDDGRLMAFLSFLLLVHFRNALQLKLLANHESD